MVFYSPLDLTKILMKYEDELGLEFDGKTYEDCIHEIQDICPDIYTDEELKGMLKHNLAEMCERFGFRGVRVWFHSIRKNCMLKDLVKDEDGWGGDDLLERKYHKLIPYVNNHHIKELLFESEHQLNYFRYYKLLEDVFYDEYGSLMEKGFIDSTSNELYFIMKAVHLNCYHEDVIKAMLPTIIDYLTAYNCKYYLGLDLTEPENLEELYLHLAEENWDEEAYRGFTIFHSNDGWGNTVHDKWEHWEEDGKRCSKLIRPRHTIDDFDRKGSIWL